MTQLRYALAGLRLGGVTCLRDYVAQTHKMNGQDGSVLSSQKLVAFVAMHNPAEAKVFYRDTLGLRLLSEDSFALVFDANGTKIRVLIAAEVAPAKYTVLGWEVADIVAAAKGLQKAGVKLEIFGGFPQDELGIWKAPDGTKVAWFKDPDGNILSIAQH